MDTWIWLTLIGAGALGLFALAWWSSGRARVRGRGPERSLTQRQAMSVELNSIHIRSSGGTLGGG